MANIFEDIKEQFRSGTIVTRLIIINVAVFAGIYILYLPFFLAGVGKQGHVEQLVYDWLGVHPLPKLLFSRPWTLLTYMFAHVSLGHIFFNMLALYVFGSILNDLLPNRKVLAAYLYGGIAGAILMILVYNLSPQFEVTQNVSLLGASAGVMAIVIAAAVLAPDYRIMLLFVPVAVKWVALGFVLIDLVTLPKSNTGGHISHLGGALLGWQYIAQMQRGRDWSSWLNPLYRVWDRLERRLFRRPVPLRGYRTGGSVGGGRPASQPRRSTSTTQTTAGRRQTDNTPRPSSSATVTEQERLDAILDKIKHSGYDSLSNEEKEFLFKMSNR